MRIENRDDEFDIDDKRFYPPIVVHDNCPACGAEVERDLSEHYLSFPKANSAFDLHVDHDGCPRPNTHYGATTWKTRVVLRVTLESA